jgi:hypothetical protein
MLKTGAMRKGVIKSFEKHILRDFTGNEDKIRDYSKFRPLLRDQQAPVLDDVILCCAYKTESSTSWI